MRSSTAGKPHPSDARRRRIREMCIFSMLGALMFCSRVAMQLLPNIHLLGAFILTFTVVYRKKALIPLYIYVLIEGIYAGFALWWLAYLYVWTVLWGAAMLLPRAMPRALAAVVYPALCALHGLFFGVLCAPGEALMFGLKTWEQMLAWIAAGFRFDLLHFAGNLAAGLLILPLSELLRKLSGKST